MERRIVYHLHLYRTARAVPHRQMRINENKERSKNNEKEWEKMRVYLCLFTLIKAKLNSSAIPATETQSVVQ